MSLKVEEGGRKEHQNDWKQRDGTLLALKMGDVAYDPSNMGSP